ncbi:unnamed protein product [Ilex paraguariensis]|uniref:RING-type E3 ubiquitin transferase n=1 Tax=Ilex paraguariensis TaxID=185542 RepID=A0ABC8T7Z7_9AQUA
MAVVSPMPASPQEINRVRYPTIEITDIMGSVGEIVAESPLPARVIEDKMYVTVGKDVKDSELTLKWALHNSGGKKICILHVHQPAQKIPIMGTKFAITQLEEQEVRAYHELERQNMHKLLDKYSLICGQAGVRAEKLHIELDSIEKGIVGLISQHGIRKLVMGAALDRLYSRKMTEPKSKKAIYVRLQAPVFCHIWFICKGHLIYTREGKSDGVNVEGAGLSLAATPSISLRSFSVSEGQNDQLRLNGSAPDYRRVMSDNHGMNLPAFSASYFTEGLRPRSRLTAEGNFEEWDGLSRRSPSVGSRFSTSSSSEVVYDSASISYARTEGSETGLELHGHPDEDHHHLSPPSVQPMVHELWHQGTMHNELSHRLEKFVVEAENSQREAYEESIRRRKSEKDAIEAVHRAKVSETLYTKELRRRKEIEEALARGKEENETMKHQLDAVREELQGALEQKESLEIQIANSDRMVQELEEKIFSAVELLRKYKNEQDELKLERDDALREAEELRKKQAEASSSTHMPHFFSEFSFSEIEEATRNFDPSLKIGEGGYGNIYKGLLRQTQVAIKMLHSYSQQGPSEFQQEVNILSRLRHPNLVTLIGACPEAWILVYEYLHNGSLEDRLSCKDNTPPLSWQTRIRIAAELCSVLIFLHSCSPHSIVHGDLKPGNILLDANYVSKLSDFGICRVISKDDVSSDNTTLCCRTDPKGTLAYMDPEFLDTGELTTKSDVYSFGIILLRLLTGRSAFGITKEVQYALNKGNLKDLLDPTAGDWPFVQAKQLAHLAMSCCEKEP